MSRIVRFGRRSRVISSNPASTASSGLTPCPIPLPADIERLIFETAAWSDVRNAAITLALVSRQVQKWIDLVLYKFISLYAKTIPLFIRTMETRPPEFFSSHVKYLHFGHSVPVAHMAEVLSVCTGITGLVCRHSPPMNDNDRQILSTAILSVRPRKLEINLSFLAFPRGQLSFNHDFFRTLTHVSLEVSRTGTWPVEAMSRVVSRILFSCPNLHVCVLSIDDLLDMEELSSTWEGEHGIIQKVGGGDPRLVMIDWEAGWYYDGWDFAERMVKSQRERQTVDCFSLIHASESYTQYQR